MLAAYIVKNLEENESLNFLFDFLASSPIIPSSCLLPRFDALRSHAWHIISGEGLGSSYNRSSIQEIFRMCPILALVGQLVELYDLLFQDHLDEHGILDMLFNKLVTFYIYKAHNEDFQLTKGADTVLGNMVAALEKKVWNEIPQVIRRFVKPNCRCVSGSSMDYLYDYWIVLISRFKDIIDKPMNFKVESGCDSADALRMTLTPE